MPELIRTCIFTPERRDHAYQAYRGYAIVIDPRYEVYNSSGGFWGNPAGITYYCTRETFQKILSIKLENLPTILEEIIETNKRNTHILLESITE